MEELKPNSLRLQCKGKLSSSGAQAKSPKLVCDLFKKICKSPQNNSCNGEVSTVLLKA